MLPKEEVKELVCGIGKTEIREDTILKSEYPFEPSVVYPEKSISADEIDSICLGPCLCELHLLGDVVFVSSERKEELREFAVKHNIGLVKKSRIWELILEPYLDEWLGLSSKTDKELSEELSEKGFDGTEVSQIRSEIQGQVYKYNWGEFMVPDSYGLADTTNLDLADVLSAMRAKYDQDTFRDFYQRAIEIDRREKE